MAVAVVLEFDGTLDQYDEVMQKMGLAAESADMPEGGLFHWVTPTDSGFRVTDVWESREQFDRFAQESIGPLSAEAGITSEPHISFHAVHNYLSA
jgi:hypothetical protein